MTQNNGYGRGQSRGQSRGRNVSHRSSSYSSQSGRQTGRTGGSHNTRRRSSHNRGKGPDYIKIAVAGVLLIVAILIVVMLVRGFGAKKPEETTAEVTTEAETEMQAEVIVDGISITGMSREAAREAILEHYTWDMKVTYGEDVHEIPNLMSGKVDALLQEIFSTDTPEESYSLDTSGLEDAIAKEVEVMGEKWDKPAKNGSISSYDAASDSFLFTGAENGVVIDRDALTAAMEAAVADRQFLDTIEATGTPVEPEFSEAVAKERYKTVATFTTKTTANSKRNTNVRLASEAVNGTVLQPGEEFSFNEVVGERTAAKGYQGAAAYSNGEVVEEIGGGVCQVSSTLFNAVLKAGLTTTVRRSHTFEPSYVTPGHDATVSWGGPDYKFVNNSSAAVGIRAKYADQTCTVSIYAIPVLEDGVTYELQSEKLKDYDLPVPTYEEDQTLLPGVEKVKSNGSQGSYWQTRLVVKKNGEIISQEVDHNTTYKGHTPVILRNTSGMVLMPDGTTLPADQVPSESGTIEESDGASDGDADGGTGGNGTVTGGGPGSSVDTTVPSSNAAGTTTSPGGPGSSQATVSAPSTAATAPTSATSSPTAAAPGSSATQGGTTQIAPNPMGSDNISSNGPGQ